MSRNFFELTTVSSSDEFSKLDLMQAVPFEVRSGLSAFLESNFPGVKWLLFGMHGGLSAKVYDMSFVGQSQDPGLILRVIPNRKDVFEREREVFFTRLMSLAGISPSMHWVDDAFRVVVLQKIRYVSTSCMNFCAEAESWRLGRLVSAIHQVQVSDRRFKLCIVDRIQNAVNGIRHALPPRLIRLYHRVLELGAAHRCSVYVHHDLNPGNVLRTAGRSWVIDWELAGLGDPDYDIATALLWLVPPRLDLISAFYDGYGLRSISQEHLRNIERQKILSLSFYGFILQMISGHSSIKRFEVRCKSLKTRIEHQNSGQQWAPFASVEELANYAQALLYEAEQRLEVYLG